MHVLTACCLLVFTPAASGLPERQTAVPPAPIVELLDAYDAGRFETVEKIVAAIPDLAKFSLDLQKASNSWVAAARPDATQRRRLIAAAVALEAAGVHIQQWPVGRDLLKWAAFFTNRGPPTEAEHVWNLAAVALIQGAQDSTPLINEAILRFPAEDRFHLAEAIARELHSWRLVHYVQPTGRSGFGNRSPTAILRDVVKAFEPLLARASIRAEVHLRLGQTYLRLNQPKVALEHLLQVEPLAKDPFLRYLANYCSGKAREAMGDAAGAEAAYRRALEIFPRAQSASFAYAALAFDRDARDEAHAIVESAIATETRVEDPWRAYQAADFRFWTSFVALVRRGLR
jgi:tetratricopeptide (TPR) repeat protein